MCNTNAYSANTALLRVQYLQCKYNQHKFDVLVKLFSVSARPLLIPPLQRVTPLVVQPEKNTIISDPRANLVEKRCGDPNTLISDVYQNLYGYIVVALLNTEQCWGLGKRQH